MKKYAELFSRSMRDLKIFVDLIIKFSITRNFLLIDLAPECIFDIQFDKFIMPNIS
jgi:hypothetical protein